MKSFRFATWTFAVLLALVFSDRGLGEIGIPSPAAHFGFEPGTDRMLFDYGALAAYLKKLDDASPRVKLLEIGKSPMGRPMFILFVSSEKNISDLDTLREINRRLALDPGIPDAGRARLLDEGRVFLLATMSMHSDEFGPTQAVPRIAHFLAETKDPDWLERLDRVVLMIVPNHNPDGMDMAVANYRKYRDTNYEGCSMPGVYHKYVGHDNNRDFVSLTQEDTRAVARIYNRDWFPQVMIEKHQMSTSGPRYYVPPPHDPIAENVDAGIWTWMGLFGSAMARDMADKGLAGVAQRYAFDDYWPGSTETCIWKGVIGMLSEAASVKDASPVFIEPNEIQSHGKGLSEHKKSSNMPLPWPGGWWRLSDLVEYETVSMLSLASACARERRDILRFRNDLCRSEVRRGLSEAPRYFVLPVEQRDPGEWVRAIRLLQEHGVTVFRTTGDCWAGDTRIRSGDAVVPLAQPFRAFIKEIMERQTYPVRRYTPDGKVIRPYDVTSWSLPLHSGLAVFQIDARNMELESRCVPAEEPFRPSRPSPPAGKTLAYRPEWNDSHRAAWLALANGASVRRLTKTAVTAGDSLPAGTFLISGADRILPALSAMDVTPQVLETTETANGRDVARPRIALVESWFHDMDAGWTRFVFDTYGVPYEIIRPGDFKKTAFTKRYDMVVFPNQDPSILMEGKVKAGDNQYQVTDYPPEFTKGIGKEGMKPLLEFVEAGGVVVAWGGSCDLFKGTLTIERSKDDKEEFLLPARNVAEDLVKKEFTCPGSLLRTRFVQGHPLTWGMDTEAGVFFSGGPVFQTSVPIFDMDRRALAVYPEKKILLSGYCEKEELLGSKTALVWVRKGLGQFVLFGFNPQFRASTPATFKLLFNALLLPKLTADRIQSL
jgi:hypothetical protein